MDFRDKRLWIAVLLFFAAGGLYLFFRDHGSKEAGEVINTVADELTGNRALRQGEDVKNQIELIKQQRKEQFKEIERE